MYSTLKVNYLFQDKTFDFIREEILETRERIHVANEQDVEILGKMKEDLATGDDDLKMQLHEANIRITQLEALQKNH